MKWFEGEMVAFDLSAGEQGFPDSVSKQTCSKSRITSEVDPQRTWFDRGRGMADGRCRLHRECDGASNMATRRGAHVTDPSLELRLPVSW